MQITYGLYTHTNGTAVAAGQLLTWNSGGTSPVTAPHLHGSTLAPTVYTLSPIHTSCASYSPYIAFSLKTNLTK